MTKVLIGSMMIASVGWALAPASERSLYHAGASARSSYVYNVFYTYENPTSDAAVSVAPFLSAHSKPRFFNFETELNGLYEKFTSQTVQDHFDYSGYGKMSMNEGGFNTFDLEAKQESFSDPAYRSNYARVAHQRSTLTGTFSHKTDGGNLLKLIGTGKYEDINVPAYTFNPHYLAHYDVSGKAEYDTRFLPETYWFSRLSGGFREYLTPNLDSNSQAKFGPAQYGETSVKTRSIYALAEVGLNGRLTDKTSVDCATGYLWRHYWFWEEFLSPVFYLHFIEQVTRRDQLIAGYDYAVEDAYSSNYLLNQEIYIGLARVMGDQLLILSKITYAYANYSLPVPRNDQRVTGGLTVKYSLSANIKLMGEIKVDLMASDAYNTQGGVSVPFDAPASYKAGSFSLGVTASL